MDRKAAPRRPVGALSAGRFVTAIRQRARRDNPSSALALKIWIFALCWLLFLTALAASASFEGMTPIDARTAQSVQGLGVHVESSLLAVAIEPFSAIGWIIVGAPDYRVTAAAAFCWLAVIAATASYWLSERKVGKPAYLTFIDSCAGAGAALLILGFYLSFMLLIPLPSGSLVASDRSTIITDLHSHTLLSYDAIASCEDNFAYHRNGGYSVTAITDHFSDAWPTAPGCSGAAYAKNPEIINGVEVFGVEFTGFLLVLGVRADLLPAQLASYDEDRLAAAPVGKFIASVHEAGGAVIALSYRLRQEGIRRLVDAGIDGFEIANFGHPNLTDDVRAALVEVQHSHRLALVADSDWHGWSGFARAWTLIRPLDAAADLRKSTQVIDALRTRDNAQITPVLLHELGSQSVARGIFSPFLETFRYARELTPARLASWWCWTLMVAGLAVYMRKCGYKPGACIFGGTLMVLAVGLLVRGTVLIGYGLSGAPFPLPLEIGVFSWALGVFALLLAYAFLAPPLAITTGEHV